MHGGGLTAEGRRRRELVRLLWSSRFSLMICLPMLR
jgi:hypothetical protein